LRVPHRPLVFVSALTGGDYLLWKWSLNGAHDAVALVAGLTLPPLALACLWLLALTLGRLLAGGARRRPAAPYARVRRSAAVRAEQAAAPTTAEQPAGAGHERSAPPRKIAA
jgi:hypothetical protein